MSEIRFDPISGHWVIAAPERAARPSSTRDAEATPAPCPFCPGHEQLTPPEVMRVPAGPEPWQVRVVPNRFAALAGDQTPTRRTTPAGFVSMDGTGGHEVVIESPDHGWDFARADQDAIRAVLDAYQARYRALRDQGAAAVVIFRNHGQAAGTSLAHPHSQIIACPVVPDAIRGRVELATRYFDWHGRSPWSDLVERELSEGVRIVLATGTHVVLQPFASTTSHETWVVPRQAEPSFAQASAATLEDLADVLGATLGALDRLLGDPAYNMVVESAPARDEDLDFLCWHIRILPRLTVPAGFELGSGVHIVPSTPEATAAALRDAIAAR